MTELAHSYAAITKSEKQADGTLKVYGKATDDAIDIDQQICDESWLQRAMPDWFITGGNIREQHSNIAAGVATDYESKSDGHYITALVVDPVSVKKVETGVLKGFSIGIRSPRVVRDNKAANGRIIDGQIVEVSLVDRPANPNAKLMLAKAAESGQLMAVDQTPTPTPADVARVIAKSTDAETETETPEVEAPEIVTEAPAEEIAAKDEVEAGVELINAAKGTLAELLKFDQTAFDAATSALADLIAVEAGEIKEGHDERHSIKELLRSIKHLFRWYQGEVEEGEVEGVLPEHHDTDDDEAPLEGIFMAADPEAKPGDKKPAFGEKPAAGDEEAEAEKCEKCDKIADECKCSKSDDADKAKSDKSATLDLADDALAVEDIINKAVQTARESVATELEQLKAAQIAAEQRAAELQVNLEDALSKAAAGGPVRTAIKSTKTIDVDELMIKAAGYRAKADATLDQLLAKGYRELATDLEKKARKSQKG